MRIIIKIKIYVIKDKYHYRISFIDPSYHTRFYADNKTKNNRFFVHNTIGHNYRILLFTIREGVMPSTRHFEGKIRSNILTRITPFNMRSSIN